MSFLAPLYALGALTIALPILFHLIRRRPQAQAEFSSLMFLTQSPPRLTKRSRLDQWPLLLLRALALLLLALAFARPFLRSIAQQDAEPASRRVLVLVDTSGSMQREDLWSQAQRQVAKIVDSSAPGDQIALAAFDSVVKPIIGFDDQDSTTATMQAKRIEAAMADLSPTYAGSNLGAALVTAADMLHNFTEDIEAGKAAPAEIVIVSDLQEGCDLTALRQYQWPQTIAVSAASVAIAQTAGNLSAVVLPQTAQADQEGKLQLRVRFHNTGDSQNDQFMYFWDSGDDRQDHVAQVPPGENRVVRIEIPPGKSNTLRFVGDRQPFDNQVHVALPTKLQQRVLYVGARSDDKPTGLFYFLQQATLSNPRREVAMQQVDPEKLPARLEPRHTPLVVLGNTVSDTAVSALQQYLIDGGHVLVVLEQSQSGYAAIEASLRDIADSPSLSISEAKVQSYAMLGKINFQHPLFLPFADPSFNDFTKIRFWSHRRLDPGDEHHWQTVTQFDDADPALIEKSFGRGRLWVLAAGWQPQQSQLALSTKFVPLLSGMLKSDAGTEQLRAGYEIGTPGVLPVQLPCELILPDGTVASHEEPIQLLDLKAPGVYHLIDDGNRTAFAMNLPADESRTTPLSQDQLEQYGLTIGQIQSAAEIAEQQRQLHDVELESRQKLWQWMIFIALGVLVTETWLGGRLAGRND